MFVCQLCLVIF